ncbi:MAG: exosortase-associated EpsI family protein [Methanophagales archaeon ANME-1-THS]|nr:MAG: exosortase-associated EpsI family protein [Methanophagales archaeon ANME-1-THS]
MRFFEEYARVIGFLLLTFVLILLFSTPSMLMTKSITTIGTELSYASGTETPVRTLVDFKNKEQMRAFPGQIGDWRSSEYNTTKIGEQLGAETLLMRAYFRPRVYQPVFFLILQSSNRSSFHPPPVCYAALGYSIEEEGTEDIVVQNLSWVQGRWRSEQEATFNGTIAVKRLIVAKKSNGDGRVAERRVVLYFYVKDNPFTSDTVTMIRAEALAPLDGSYESVLMVMQEFMGDTIPCMFELQKDEPPFIIILITGSGIGKLALVLLLLVPLALIFYPEFAAKVSTFYTKRVE